MRARVPLVMVTMTTIFAVCSVVSGTANRTPVEDVLSLVPLQLGSPQIWFTDWDALKAATGFSWVNSRTPIDLKLAFARRLNQDLAAAAAYGIEFFRGHAETWGFDFTDLSWEAEILGHGLAPFRVLKFRDGFDLSPLVAVLGERGFVQTESFGVTVYQRDLALGSDWLRTTELAIHHTAVFADGLLVLSSSPGAVEAVLATQAGESPSLSEHPFAARLLSHLRSPHTGVLLLDPSFCLRLAASDPMELLLLGDASRLAEELQTSSGTAMDPYFAFGLGIRFALDPATGEVTSEGAFVMEYGDVDAANENLAARETLAAAGAGTRSPEPLFVLDQAEVVDGAILLRVTPLERRPTNLLRMLLYADLPFAACD
ncbi:hypothetical protein JW848_03085 [Candidatus Bipolaricaulota bacterium]|nr:hypothetical protein [Candidatus Bipolaricaulota bacterium]